MRKQQPRFFLISCSLVVMKDATPLTPPPAHERNSIFKCKQTYSQWSLRTRKIWLHNDEVRGDTYFLHSERLYFQGLSKSWKSWKSNVWHLVRWQAAKLHVKISKGLAYFHLRIMVHNSAISYVFNSILTLVKLTYTNKSMYCETKERWWCVADKGILDKDCFLTKLFRI